MMGVAALLALLAAPGPATADLSIVGVRGGPVAPFNLESGLPLSRPGELSAEDPCVATAPTLPFSLQAGATTDYCVAIEFGARDPLAGDDLDRLLIELPQGTSLDPTGQVRCAEATFDRAGTTRPGCPAAAQVGTSVLRLLDAAGNERRLPGRIFLLESASASTTRFGITFSLSPDGAIQGKQFVTATVTPDRRNIVETDSLIRTIPSDLGPQAVAITGFAVRLWGPASAHRHVRDPDEPATPELGAMAADFARVGRDCATAQAVAVAATPTRDTPSTAASPIVAARSVYQLIGCTAFPADSTGVAARVSTPSAGLKALPPLSPRFGTQRRARGATLGVLRIVLLSDQPPGTAITVTCTRACGKARGFSMKFGKRGAPVQRKLTPGWAIRSQTRLKLVARAAGYAPVEIRYRFKRLPEGVFAFVIHETG
jgi:hypothetical protein